MSRVYSYVCWLDISVGSTECREYNITSRQVLLQISHMYGAGAITYTHLLARHKSLSRECLRPLKRNHSVEHGELDVGALTANMVGVRVRKHKSACGSAKVCESEGMRRYVRVCKSESVWNFTQRKPAHANPLPHWCAPVARWPPSSPGIHRTEM